jgi:aspartyl/asparaginyl beta-hydroxylase (cupin superfamily)
MITILSLSLLFIALHFNHGGPIFSSSLIHPVSHTCRTTLIFVGRRDNCNHRNTNKRRRTSLQMIIAPDADLPDTSQSLDPQTLAGTIEKGLKEKFDEHEISRILTSWRLVDKEYYRREYVGSTTEHQEGMIQECHSYVPGLSVKSFWDEQQFDWAKSLESSYSDIREEFDAVTANLSRLKREGNNIWAGALTDDASSYGEGWKTLALMDRGRWDDVNANLFPKTCQAVYKSGVPATEIFFACMEGPSSIKKHSDFTNFVLTSHLALDIPNSGENKCRLTVGDETRQWINGKVSVFDTSLLHDAINESDQTRYILMMRFWHPDLSSVEKEALQFTFDTLEFPELISSDPKQQLKAEKIVELSRSFPLTAKGFGKKKKKEGKQKSGRGFG